MPNVDSWWRMVGEGVISTLLGLLRSLAPTDPVLVLGVLECDDQEVDHGMLRDLFGFSKRNQHELSKPQRVRYQIFPIQSTANTLAALAKGVFWSSYRLPKYVPG